MKSLLALIGIAVSVVGITFWVIPLLIFGVGAIAIMYIGIPLLSIPSLISGVDIAGRVMTNTFCQAISINPDRLFSMSMLPIWIGCILFFTMEGGIYVGTVMTIVGTFKATQKGNVYYRESWKYDTLKKGLLLLIVGIVASIILGFLIRNWYATGIC